ncbi:hypothetical protein BGZ96_011913 [Linnemannia gamsii]|uniref:YTH domain-containing protein n=1 Tax=Linnemannia gamsii TaxID=64522 RepID=A0ABQ7JRT4_9FUNG|nr:hypothetical protein BGZ96_011913 [Linnemannia gamsii]
MGKGKQVIVSWDDLDDDDLFDEDLIESSQRASATDDATSAASIAVASPRIFRNTEPAVLTPMNKLHLDTLDLRNEINQLSTSNSNINIHGRPELISGTNPGVDHHIDGDWKSESSWRNGRKGASKPTLPVKEDLRDAITTMTLQMKDLESPGTRATGSGITLVTIRNNSDPKPESSPGKPSALDVIAAPPKRDSYRARSRSRSRSKSRESSRRRKSRSSMDLTRPTRFNTTTASSPASSPVTDSLLITDPNLANEHEDPTTTTKIKLEPEDDPSLSQVVNASSPEEVVKQESPNPDDATKILREVSQPATTTTRTTTTTTELGLPDPMEAEVGAQDAHYVVIRVSDEVDFNDARKNSTSQVFLIFTVFMSSEFCGIAKMASEMMWMGERTIFDKSTLRQKFKLQWVACSRVSYDSVKELTHEPVYKIIRKNGYELTQDMGGAIHKLLVENQPEEEPQLALALQEADNNALDISTTSFSQDMLMGNSIDGQDGSTLLLDSMFRDTSDMDVDVSEPTAIGFNDKDKDDNEYDVDYGDDRSSMDLDSNPDVDVALTEPASPKATLQRSPRARKRSISADENVDLSTELELAHEEREQWTRGRSSEPSYVERVDQETYDKEDRGELGEKEELEEEAKEVGKAEAFIRQDASPIRARSPRKHDPPPLLTPLHPSLPSRRWSPSRRRSPPPPRPRSSPPPRRRSSPPPPRRNRSPPPPRRRSPPPLRRRSPPPPHYHRQPSYDRPGSVATSTPYYGFKSPPPFPQRSKDPRDRSVSTYVFHSGSGPNYQRDRFNNAPTDPRLSGNRSASSSVIPQKRLYDETSGSLEDDKSGILGEGEFDDLPASVFPLADDDDDGMSGHFAPPAQAGNPTVAVGSSSSLAPMGGASSSTSTVPPADPPPQITSITLVPAGLSKSRRKKMRKEAFNKPLDF